MVSLEFCKEIEKYTFHLGTSVGQRKHSESPGGIEPQTYRFRTLMLSHKDSKVSKVYYEVHVTSCVLHTARIVVTHYTNSNHLITKVSVK